MNRVPATPTCSASERYEVEELLNIAERRYARAKELLTRARDEFETLNMRPGVRTAALEASRARMTGASERCVQLRREIGLLEQRLEPGQGATSRYPKRSNS